MRAVDMDRGQQSLLDAARTQPVRRERMKALLCGCGWMLLFVLSAGVLCTQGLTEVLGNSSWRRSFLGMATLVCLFRGVARLLSAWSLSQSPRWGADALSRLPPNIAKLAGLPPAPAESSRRRGFALGGGMFAGGDGGDTRDGTEMTTPEVLRSTSLRSRSAVRSATPSQQQQRGTPGAAGGFTPGNVVTERRLFSPKDTSNNYGRVGPLTSLERGKAGRRALAVRPEDVPALMQSYDRRHVDLAISDGISNQSTALGYHGIGGGFQHGAGMGGYYGQGAGDAGGVWGAGVVSPMYQPYRPGETEVANRSNSRSGREAERDRAEQVLLRLGIAGRTDEFTKNVKTYIVQLMRRYLEELRAVCDELKERGIAEDLLTHAVQRQSQLRVRSIPRAFVNLSLKDMATQFGNQPEFLVRGNDGQPVSLFQKYQHLAEALHVTTGAGAGAAAGVGNPSYVLQRLKDLAEDDFLSAFVYDKGYCPEEDREWTEDLPTDAAIVMRFFVCCADNWLPREWAQDRPFARQHFVDRQPCSSDALPGRYFLARSEPVYPPHFFVVANQEVWQALPGPTNVFQAIALFLYSIKTKKSGYLGTGIGISKVLTEIFP